MQKLKELLAKPRLACIVLVLLTLAVWGKTVRFDFVWDDEVLVLHNPSVLSLKNIPAMFYSLDSQSSQNIDVPLSQKIPSFRPLRTMHYAILHALDGKDLPQPWIYHLANVLWHTAAVLLLYSIVPLLFQGNGQEDDARIFALLTAAAFAVHPVTSEVVCWVKSLDDLMATVFVLASTRALLLWNRGRKYRVTALLYFVLAIYSKESAVPFALLAVVLLYGFHRLPWRAIVPWAAAFFGFALIYMVHRDVVMGRTVQSEPISGTYFQTLIDTIATLAVYFRLAWGIPPFSMDYAFLPGRVALFSGAFLASVALILACGISAILAWRSEKFRPAAFGLLWLGLFFLPASNLLPMMQYMAERFLYLPLIGFLLALGTLLWRLPKRNLAVAMALALIAIWIPSASSRAAIWHDELTLFIQSSLETPHSKRVEKNAVVAIFRLPQMQRLFPDYLKTRKLLMTDSLSPAQAEPVIETLAQAHQLFPDNTLVTTCLGFTFARIGRFDQAIPLMELAAHQDAQSPRAWYNAASVYWSATNLVQALEADEKALQLDPNFPDALRLKTNVTRELQASPPTNR